MTRRPSAVTSWSPSTTAGAEEEEAGGNLDWRDLGGLSRLTPGLGPGPEELGMTVTCLGDTLVLVTGVRLRREAGTDREDTGVRVLTTGGWVTGVRPLRPGGADTG